LLCTPSQIEIAMRGQGAFPLNRASRNTSLQERYQTFSRGAVILSLLEKVDRNSRDVRNAY
jgi:hypothetical protein